MSAYWVGVNVLVLLGGLFAMWRIGYEVGKVVGYGKGYRDGMDGKLPAVK